MPSKADTPPTDALHYPWESHPGPDQVVEVLPGVLWLRLKLPFRLNHVNVYLIADGDGWALFDTGFGNEATIAAWTTLLEGELSGVQLSRVIVSHAHPDHLGLAGWLVARFQCPLQMSQLEFLHGVYHQHRRTEERVENSRLFFRRHGMDEAMTLQLLGRGQDYLKKTVPMPAAYQRLSHGNRLMIGGREFQVMTGAGHSPDQVMLYCAADNFLLSADQVLSKISPNVSVWAQEPDEDALGAYLHSLRMIAAAVPDDALVLPGHGVPFYGLQVRIGQLAAHHEERCEVIAEACIASARTAAELVPIVFNKHVLDAHQAGFAAGEVIAHVNYLLAQGRLKQVDHRAGICDGLLRFKTS